MHLRNLLLLALALSAVLNGSSAVAGITAKPEFSIDRTVHGPEAQFVNGSILAAALKTEVVVLRDRARYSNATRLLVHVTPDVSLETTVGNLRAIERAEDQLKRVEDGAVMDRALDHYDVLVFPIVSGPNAGNYFVEFVHHHAAGATETRIGCVDSAGGYDASYIVDARTGSVTLKPCS